MKENARKIQELFIKIHSMNEINEAIENSQSPIVIDRVNNGVYRFTYELWEHIGKPNIDLNQLYLAIVDSYNTYNLGNKDFDMEKFK